MAENSGQQDQGLEALREQLLTFIIAELGQRLDSPGVARLPEALARAIDAEVAAAFQRHMAAANMPDPALFRDELFEAARLGARDQIARDKQFDAMANRLAIVASGVEQLLRDRGIDFDAGRAVDDSELAALSISRGPVDTGRTPVDKSLVSGGDSRDGGDAPTGWRAFVRRWSPWIVGVIVAAALGGGAVVWFQQNGATAPQTPKPGLVTLPAEPSAGEAAGEAGEGPAPANAGAPDAGDVAPSETTPPVPEPAGGIAVQPDR